MNRYKHFICLAKEDNPTIKSLEEANRVEVNQLFIAILNNCSINWTKS